jgi:hypothetical protein
MNKRPNNILSYFIKDIKDATELAFYKQVIDNGMIRIFYKDKLIYSMNEYSCNYINNIKKNSFLTYIDTYKNGSYSIYKTKFLYYKKDNTIKLPSLNYIRINFIYNKYFNKRRVYYCMNNKYLLFVSILYFKKYKYIMNYNMYIERSIKFTSSRILIPNKYELDYYCKLFNLYFVNN